jgi:hypothetical protein
VLPFQLLIAVFDGWLHREQADVIAFLREENRILKARLTGQRLRLADSERRRLAELGQPLGRRVLAQIATLVRRIPSFDGIASSWRGSGPIELGAAVLVCRRTFEPWSSGWPPTIRRGGTHGFRARRRTSGIGSGAQPSPGFCASVAFRRDVSAP